MFAYNIFQNTKQAHVEVEANYLFTFWFFHPYFPSHGKGGEGSGT